MYIDTHAHLNYPAIKNNIDDILSRAQDSGIIKIIVPSTNYQTSIEIIELIEKYEILFGAVGIHPNDLNGFDESHIIKIEELTKNKKIVAVGEIGLDYYWKPYDKELQHKVLRAQLQIAKRNNLPVILHNRESSEDLMKIITEEYEDGKPGGQFHSFSGDIDMASKCVEMGFYISFTGNITYKPNEKTRMAYEIIKRTPIEMLLLETDSPYLPPVPYRGKQNEPSYLKYTTEKIAELKNMNVEEISKITTKNAEKLFKI
ncbi:MAG: TatD family hydrolase [Ignavibacteria bacterium]